MINENSPGTADVDMINEAITSIADSSLGDEEKESLIAEFREKQKEQRRNERVQESLAWIKNKEKNYCPSRLTGGGTFDMPVDSRFRRLVSSGRAHAGRENPGNLQKEDPLNILLLIKNKGLKTSSPGGAAALEKELVSLWIAQGDTDFQQFWDISQNGVPEEALKEREEGSGIPGEDKGPLTVQSYRLEQIPRPGNAINTGDIQTTLALIVRAACFLASTNTVTKSSVADSSWYGESGGEKPNEAKIEEDVKKNTEGKRFWALADAMCERLLTFRAPPPRGRILLDLSKAEIDLQIALGQVECLKGSQKTLDREEQTAR
jgi:hypothetical protein